MLRCFCDQREGTTSCPAHFEFQFGKLPFLNLFNFLSVYFTHSSIDRRNTHFLLKLRSSKVERYIFIIVDKELLSHLNIK